MKKKYQPPRMHKITLDIEQALLKGCKKAVAGASGNRTKTCSQRCTTAIGT